MMKTSKMMMIMLTVVGCVCAALNGWADTAADADKTLSPYFLVQSAEPGVDQLPLLFTGADVQIAGVIADVTVTQVYKNEGARPLEAIYVFPGSTRAAVYGMTMTIGDRTIFAQIREREQARQEYEQAKQAGKTASLLEQERPNVFQMNVANILPGDKIKVELKYTELLVPTDGVYEFVYPTVVGPRYSHQAAANAAPNDQWVANPYLPAGAPPTYLFDITTHLATGLPLQEVSCPSHHVTIGYDGPAAATVNLADVEMLTKIRALPPDQLARVKTALQELYFGKDLGSLPAFYTKLFRIATDPAQPAEEVIEAQPVKNFTGDRDYILRYRLAGGQIESGLLLSAEPDENFFLLMVQPPQHVPPEAIPPREYIFIMDVSGSMNGFPIELAKKLMRNLLTGLRPTDTFNVVLFAGGSAVLADRSLPATPGNIAQAASFIKNQTGRGGTELLPALQRAFALPKTQGMSRTVVIATDGYVDVELAAFDLIRANLHEANLFAFGIGTSVNRFLIEGLARVGVGEPFIVTKAAEADAKAAQFRQYVQTPVLTDVTVHWGGFDVHDVEPASIPDVFAQRPIIVFGKWKRPLTNELTGKITVRGLTGALPYAQTFDLTDIKPQAANAALRYLWARKRIELLGDYNALSSSDARVKEITHLGLTYHLLTAYTSFIAVDAEVRRKDGDVTTVKQPAPLPKNVSNYAVSVGIPEPSTLVLVGLGLLGLLALRRQRPQA